MKKMCQSCFTKMVYDTLDRILTSAPRQWSQENQIKLGSQLKHRLHYTLTIYSVENNIDVNVDEMITTL